jgi:integrase
VPKIRLREPDKWIEHLQPTGRQIDFQDRLISNLHLRLLPSGVKTFVLTTRYPGYRNPTRRALGRFGVLTLDTARAKAREWIALIEKGIDPEQHEAELRAQALLKNAESFAAVATAFKENYAPTIAKRTECEAAVDEMIARWGPRPFTAIRPHEFTAWIGEVAKRGTYQAFNYFGHARRLYSWAVGRGYEIAKSPLDDLVPSDIIGAKREARERILDDDELRTLWTASLATPYPHGPAIQLLLRTAQRKTEVLEASWPEFDLDKALWTIPASRMKSDRAHVVPLAPETVKLLKALPRGGRGDYLFSTDAGEHPISGFSSKAKKRLDDASGVKGWVIHDLRRTARTHFSALEGVTDLVRELSIAHAKPGLHKVYDQFAYIDEKRDLFVKWEHRFAGILNPKPATVTDLDSEREARA